MDRNEFTEKAIEAVAGLLREYALKRSRCGTAQEREDLTERFAERIVEKVTD